MRRAAEVTVPPSMFKASFLSMLYFSMLYLMGASACLVCFNPEHAILMCATLTSVMSLFLDINSTSKQAFYRGFWRGLAGPLALFSRCEVPSHIKTPEALTLPKRRLGSIRDDWRAVGDELQAAYDKVTSERV